MSIEQFLENITLEQLEEFKKIKELEVNKIPTFSFSTIKFNEISKLVKINKCFNFDKFNKWFDNKIEIDLNTVHFLQALIDDNIFLIDSYKEEDLKVKFLTPILNKIKFLNFDNNLRDFYNEKLIYKTDKFILNGETDFMVAKGLIEGEKPYFFIQEFKKGKTNSDPEPQLISAVELNNWDTIKGAYIVGAIWNFVILERIEKHKYQYYVSINFDSTKIDDLKDIYKNLMFIKNEIIEMVKNEN